MTCYISGIVEPVPIGQASKDFLSRKVNPTLLKGLTELCKQKPLDPVVSTHISLSVFKLYLKLKTCPKKNNFLNANRKLINPL